MKKIRRALISVSDKTGMVEFAAALHGRGVEILSTGGTARLLADGGVPVIEVSDYTGFPEMMDGRVKTLHPKIHGGILGRRGTDDAGDARTTASSRSTWWWSISIPSSRRSPSRTATLEDAIENIDIGGPTMLRSAAKNHADVTVVVDRADYAARAGRDDAAAAAPSATPTVSVWRSRSSSTPPPTTAPSPTIWARIWRRRRPIRVPAHPEPAVPARAGDALRRESAPGRRLLRRAARRPRRRIATARQIPGQGTLLQQHRRHGCGAGVRQAVRRGAGLRHRQARQPLRRGHRRESCWRPTTAPISTDPESAFGGIIAFNGELDARHRAGHRRAPVRRGDHRPTDVEPAARGVSRPRRTSACWSAATGRRSRSSGWISSGSTAGCWCRTRTCA